MTLQVVIFMLICAPVAGALAGEAITAFRLTQIFGWFGAEFAILGVLMAILSGFLPLIWLFGLYGLWRDIGSEPASRFRYWPLGILVVFVGTALGVFVVAA